MRNSMQEQEVQKFIKRGFYPWVDLVSFHPKMSEVRRSQRLQQATDFSIARILGTDEKPNRFASSSSSVSPSEDRVPKLPTNNCASCPRDGGSFLSPLIATPMQSQDRTPEELERRTSASPRLIDEKQRNPREESSEVVPNPADLPWLHCTRYRPPRLPKRSSAGKISKRKPGKHPRIPFTPFQLQILEEKYRKGAYLARRDVVQLSLVLRLPQSRVKIWFQNRRARERRESLQSVNQTAKPDNEVNINIV